MEYRGGVQLRHENASKSNVHKCGSYEAQKPADIFLKKKVLKQTNTKKQTLIKPADISLKKNPKK